MNTSVDIAFLRQWIGSEESASDVVAPSMIDRFCATIPSARRWQETTNAAPRLIHFCLCQPAASIECLGPDGHPARGGFLPPIPLPRRMWAGSDIAFFGDIHAGDEVHRRSRVENIEFKNGRSGALYFVTVRHLYTVGTDAKVEERQSVVYREAQIRAADDFGPPAAIGTTSLSLDPSTILLFRYSALTFNGHRIHFDAEYARGEEGYRGLVVHGPLQATLLFNLAASVEGRQPDRFIFRSVSSLFADESMQMHAGTAVDGSLPLWMARKDGPIAMRAEASWS